MGPVWPWSSLASGISGTDTMRGATLSLALGLAAFPADADPAADMVQQLLTAPPEAAQFAPAFLAAVPLTDIAALLEGLRSTIGPPTDIAVTGDTLVITTATHRMRGRIGLDGDGRVAMLFLEPPEPMVADLDSALAAIRALGTETAWLVLRDGTVLAAEGASEPLAVASAFKLGVLAVLAKDVQSGLRHWDDVVVLAATDLSLPTGILQDHPVGAPLTLHTAAALMISVSDNTATDLLIRVLGRDRIAGALGIDPLLTTREVFALKAESAAAAAYLAAPPGDRAAIAVKAALTLPAGSQAMGHFIPGIEWHVSLDRLCALAIPLSDLPLMAINPGPVPEGDWQHVAFKGGSEPGVLNFTAVLHDAGGRTLCVAISVNSQSAVDELAATVAFRGLLAVLSGQN
jgi:beta-lactamase class A